MSSLFLPAPIRTKPKPAARNNSAKQHDGNTTSSSSNPNSSSLVVHGRSGGGGSGGNQKKALPQKAPSYEQRCRAASEFSRLSPAERKSKKLFVPRSLADFDDGGAFPEIHVAQYPRNMSNPHMNRMRRNGGGADEKNKGKKSGGGGGGGSGGGTMTVGSSSATTRALANIQIGADGKKDYTSLIRGGTNADKKVYAHHTDLRGFNPTKEEVALPTKEEETSAATRTQEAINNLLSTKIAMSKPSGTALANAATSKNQEEKTQFIEYTPNPDAPGYNPAAAKRVIQMVPAQIDPMMPPKHKHVKAPAGPAEDFVPVLHAPPEKLTKEEKAAWNVPACISNWKNTRGYTIPLDKRLAADGRGLRDDATINSNFATLSESLYLAERQAREEVRLRALVQKRQVEGDRERREKELRELAMKARMDRGGVVSGGAINHDNNDVSSAANEDEGHDQESVIPVGEGNASQHDRDDRRYDDARVVEQDEGDDEDDIEAEKRERIRQARRRERERELRMEKHKPSLKRDGEEEEEEDVAVKKARLGDRDVSEKIALGVHTGGASLGGIDSRLYNQNAGMDSGFGADDEYNAYTKPMFDRSGVTSASIYRPSRGEGAMDADDMYNSLKSGATSKFQPDKGFAGAESGGRNHGSSSNGPVQFERGDAK